MRSNPFWRHKNAFKMPGSGNPTPVAPTPAPPPPMPDPFSPAALEARRAAMAKGAMGGRSSTILTSAAANTLAGGAYGGTKLGGG